MPIFVKIYCERGCNFFGNKKHLDTREAGWIEGAKQGDRKSQKAIYDRLSAKMFAVCLRYMGDRDSAEDILQDGFVTSSPRSTAIRGQVPSKAGPARSLSTLH